jgi:hypothetical protein
MSTCPGATADRPLCVAILRRDRGLAGVPRVRLAYSLRTLGNRHRLGAEHPAPGAAGSGWRYRFTRVTCPSALRYSRSSSSARRSGSEVALRPSPTSIVVFVYAHIPLLLALTAVSAGISLAIEQSSAAGLGAGVRQALAGGAAVYLAFVTAAQAARAQGVSAGVLRSRIGAAMALVVLALVGGAGPGRVHGRSGERSRRRCRRQALGGRTRTPVERGLNWTPCLDRRWAS